MLTNERFEQIALPVEFVDQQTIHTLHLPQSLCHLPSLQPGGKFVVQLPFHV